MAKTTTRSAPLALLAAWALVFAGGAAQAQLSSTGQLIDRIIVVVDDGVVR